MATPIPPILGDLTEMRITRLNLLAAIMLGASFAAGAETEIHLAWVGAADSDARKGVGLGVSEANLQGRFLGYKVHLHDYHAKLKGEHNAVAILTERQGDELEMILVAQGISP